jgi:HSP90 family molecular chaperone
MEENKEPPPKVKKIKWSELNLYSHKDLLSSALLSLATNVTALDDAPQIESYREEGHDFILLRLRVNSKKFAELDERVLKDIEKILRQMIKTKTLTEEAFVYMALLINEDCPKNAAELVSLIGDFMTDGMSYTDEEAFKHCESIIRTILD